MDVQSKILFSLKEILNAHRFGKFSVFVVKLHSSKWNTASSKCPHLHAHLRLQYEDIEILHELFHQGISSQRFRFVIVPHLILMGIKVDFLSHHSRIEGQQFWHLICLD